MCDVYLYQICIVKIKCKFFKIYKSQQSILNFMEKGGALQVQQHNYGQLFKRQCLNRSERSHMDILKREMRWKEALSVCNFKGSGTLSQPWEAFAFQIPYFTCLRRSNSSEKKHTKYRRSLSYDPITKNITNDVIILNALR